MAATGPELAFRCECGAVRGAVEDAVPAGWTHALCHCRDCRGAYAHLGRDDPGTVPLLQTTQDRIRIDAGREHLEAFRHSRQGGMRWFAACCRAPMFYLPTRPRLVIVSLNADRLEAPEAIGAPVAEAFIPAGPGRTRHRGGLRLLGAALTRLVAKNLNGEWRATPFFAEEGTPAVRPHVLTREERAAAMRSLRG